MQLHVKVIQVASFENVQYSARTKKYMINKEEMIEMHADLVCVSSLLYFLICGGIRNRHFYDVEFPSFWCYDQLHENEEKLLFHGSSLCQGAFFCRL